MHPHPILCNQPKPKRKYHVLYSDKTIVGVETEAEVEIVKVQDGPLDITAVVVNFQTEHLIKQAVRTFRKNYPTVPLVIVDNHSTDGSREWLKKQPD